MDEKLLADRINGVLGDRRTEFIADVRSAIRKHIESRGKECLTIVGRRADGAVARTWRLEPSSDYAKCLIAFCRAQQYRGMVLDSAMTDEVIDVVTERFSAFYGSHSDEIGRAVLDVLVQDRTLVDGLSKALVDALGGTAKLTGAVARQKVATLIGAQLQAAISGPAAQAISAGIAKGLASGAAVQISHTIATLMVKLLATHMQALVAHVLSSAAAKAAISVAVKKFVAAAVIGAIVKLVGTKVAAIVGGHLMVVLIPLVIAFIAYEVATFPRKLGESVSAKVSAELGAQFETVNRGLARQIALQFAGAGLGEVVRQLAADSAIRDGVGDLLAGAA